MAVQPRATLDPGLSFVLADREVDGEIQDLLSTQGFKTVPLFALLADSREELRGILRAAPFALDPHGAAAEDAMKKRISMARIIDAWEAARNRVEEQNKVEAKRRAEGLPRQLPRSDHVALRKAWEKINGAVHDKLFPSDTYVDARLEQVESGDLAAEPLTAVVSRDEDSDAPSGATVTSDGVIQLHTRCGQGAVARLLGAVAPPAPRPRHLLRPPRPHQEPQTGSGSQA